MVPVNQCESSPRPRVAMGPAVTQGDSWGPWARMLLSLGPTRLYIAEQRWSHGALSIPGETTVMAMATSHNWWFLEGIIHSPYAQCMEYLPTFTQQMAQMKVNIPKTWSIWVLFLWGDFLVLKTDFYGHSCGRPMVYMDPTQLALVRLEAPKPFGWPALTSRRPHRRSSSPHSNRTQRLPSYFHSYGHSYQL